MSENFNSHIACEGTDNDINWVCKVCKDLPNYAGMYLYQREREKNQLKNVKDRRADLILLKYYYALLHLLDKIHELHECPNPENDVPKYADRKCSTPECFVYYRYIYNTYASILMTEKGLNQINLRCDICSVLPYTIFSDLEMIAKNMHSDDMEKTQKLEIEAVIADYYLEAVGSCEQWDECPSGVDWLELIKSVQLLRKYLEKKDRKELQISLNEWNRVRSIDNILNTEIKTTCRDFQTKNIPLCVLEKKTLVYMDFGVYQLYESSHYNKTDVEVQQELGIGRTSFYKMKKQALRYLGFYFYEIVVPQAKNKRFKPSLGVEEEQVIGMKYEDSMVKIADDIIQEQREDNRIWYTEKKVR